ncbi:hypothetical protein Tco_0046287 [Tanacetum coccineum]
MEECYRALTDQLDWTNPEGHIRLVDMGKPLPLQDKEVSSASRIVSTGRMIIIVCTGSVKSSDDEHIPENDRFSKNGYKAVPPPITGNFLTPRADISFAGLDEYAIRNKIIESQTTNLAKKTSETAGKTNDANTEKPKSVSESVVSNPKINRDSVIIEDWTSDDEEEVSGVQKVRPENQTVKTRDDKSGQNSHKQGVGFRKVKAYFVCRSTEYLIKDCNFHDKKSQESHLKNGGQTRVLTRTGFVSTARPSISTARPSVNTARPVSTTRPSINTARPVSTARPSINTARPVSTASPRISIARLGYASRPIYQKRMDNGNPEICLQDHGCGDSVALSMTEQQSLSFQLEISMELCSFVESDPKGVDFVSLLPAMLARAAVDQGSAEDSMHLKELMDIVPRLVTRIETLETELQYTKTTYRKAVLTLVKRVKILEMALKRKTQKVVISESEGGGGKKTKASREAQEEDISPTILEAAKTLSKVASQGVSKEKSTDKGKRYRRRARLDAIRAKLEANAELTKDVLGKDLPEQDFSKRMVDMNIDKRCPIIVEKVVEVKEEEPVKRTGKRKKQKARKGISVDKNAQGDSKTDKEELVEAMNPTPLATKSNIVYCTKALATPEQTATGKEISNPLIADSLLKTIRHVKRGRDTKIPQSSGPPVKVGDKAVHKELGDRMERVVTTSSSLEAKHEVVPSNKT